MTPDAVTQAHQHLATALTCLTEIRSAPTSAFNREAAEHLTENLLRLGHMVDATVLHALRLLGPHAYQNDIVDFLSTSPRNLSRYAAKKYVLAAKLTDPTSPWDGAVGGVNGDRGALARVGAKLTAGDTSLAHVLHAADALTSLPTPIRRGHLTLDVLTESGEIVRTTKAKAELLDAYLAEQVCTTTVGALRQLTDDILTTLDPDRADRGLDPDSASRRALRHSTVNGMHRVTLDFDDIAYAGFRQNVLAAAAPVAGAEGADGAFEPDPRSQAQREFDAVVDLVAAGANASAPSVQQKAVLVVQATTEQLSDQLSDQFTEERDESVEEPGDDSSPEPDVSSAPTLDGHGPLTPAQFGFATCDADVVTVTCTRAGKPLSMTSTARSATPAQRLGLAVRDRGCVAPGCGAPAWLSHAHHVRFWSQGGRTDLDNLVLLCGRHHRQLHAGRLEVRFAADGLPQARWVRYGIAREWVRNDQHVRLVQARAFARTLRDDADPP